MNQTIYQEHSVFGTLNVTENLFTGMEITKNGVMQHAQMRKRTKEVLEYLNSNIDPDAIVGNLTSGEQKMVEIAKALITKAKSSSSMNLRLHFPCRRSITCSTS